VEFSNTNQPCPSDQPIDTKQNQSLPSIADQSSNSCQLSICDNAAVHTCPLVTTGYYTRPLVTTGYYKLAQEYLAKKSGGHCVSHDAWTLTREYFDNVKPHPLTASTVDWSEFIFKTKDIKCSLI